MIFGEINFDQLVRKGARQSHPCELEIVGDKTGHVNEYPTMYYFGNPGHTQSMIAYMILIEYFWKF